MYFYRNLLVFWRKPPLSLGEMNEEMKMKVAGSSKIGDKFLLRSQLHVREQARSVLENEQVY